MRNYKYYKAFINDIFWFLKRQIFCRNSASILMYHSVSDEKQFFTVSPEEFNWQMKYLQNNNYNVISLNDLIKKIQNKEIVNKKTIVITFDDGYEDNFINVYPILKQYNYPATIFLSTGLMSGHRNGLKMSNYGIDFEPHTQTHARLTELDNNQAEEEILKSKQDIENNLNKKCTCFAYPWGNYNKETIEILKNLEFISAVTVHRGFVSQKISPYELPRNFVDSWVTKFRFLLKI
jgi:peptidoglycan/xylan/chitin deacetylase (PgdA/CDA1 family)